MSGDVNKTVSINFEAKTNNLEKGLKKIPKITDKEAAAAAEKLDKNFKKMEDSADRTSKKVNNKMEKMTGDMKKLGASIAVTVGAVVLLSQKFADLTNELVDASAKSGVAVETLAGLRLAAEGAGMEFGGLADSLNQFQVQMTEAAAGAGNVKLFERLGVAVKGVDGELRSSNDVFNDTIKALGQMDNEVERNSIALKLLGEAGGAGLIQSGALENLESMTALAVEFGVAIDEKGIQSMAQFQRSMAEFTTVATGSLQKVVNSIAGDQSITWAIQGASQGAVYMGSIFSTVLGTISQGFENTIGLIQAASMAMSGDIDTARVVLGDLNRETHTAVDNLSNVFTIANDELERFNELSEKSTGPQTMSQTADGAEKTATAMEKMVAAQNKLNEEANQSLDIIDSFAEQINQRLLPDYVKQERSIKAIGNEIMNQTKELDYQMGVLLDTASTRELSADEQQRLNELVDEINILEELYAANREAEIYELAQLRKEANEEQKKAIEDRDKEIQAQKDEELRAIEEVNRAYLDKVDNISQYGSMAMDTVGALMDTIMNINETKINEMSSAVERETKAIDNMVEAGVMSYGEGAQRKKKIEDELAVQLQTMKMREYRMNKASAVADIAFGLSKAIAQSLVLPPVARGAQIAFLTALAGAQTAAVVSQPAPKFDVGGMVGQSDGGPDVVNANLLRGEAVLDRATVDRLGGQQGVQALQNGGGVGSQVVIIQPFKHFDRYNRAMTQRMSRRAGSGGY
jgi:hypothetical protein